MGQANTKANSNRLERFHGSKGASQTIWPESVPCSFFASWSPSRLVLPDIRQSNSEFAQMALGCEDIWNLGIGWHVGIWVPYLEFRMHPCWVHHFSCSYFPRPWMFTANSRGCCLCLNFSEGSNQFSRWIGRSGFIPARLSSSKEKIVLFMAAALSGRRDYPQHRRVRMRKLYQWGWTVFDEIQREVIPFWHGEAADSAAEQFRKSEPGM
jgi:hypothetical protein